MAKGLYLRPTWRSLGMQGETEDKWGQQTTAHLRFGWPPSDGAGNSHLGRPQNCPFPGLSNLLRDKIFLDAGHRRPAVLLFQFWILTELDG